MDGNAALLALLRSKDVYSKSDVTVQPYDPSRLQVFTSGITASSLRDRLPAVDQKLLDHARSRILLPPGEWDRRCDAGEVHPIYPYWDVRLRRSASLRLHLFKQLYACGLLGLRLRARTRAALFTVAKKDGTQRLIVDGREASAMCHRPPKIALGSAAAIADIDLSSSALSESFGPAATSVHTHGASADVRQGFYQLHWGDGASLFAFDYPMRLDSFDTDQFAAR